jgi:hypothetical protein
MKNFKAVDDAGFCSEQARIQDGDRYLIALFQPKPKRRAAIALAAWNLELSRVRPRSGETTIGLMRLQWHRDALEEIAKGEPRHHPVIGELAKAYDAKLFDLADLHTIIDARERDLDPAPMQNLDDLEAYARATAGMLHGCLWQKTPAAAVAMDAATAFALIGLARSEPINQARGRPWAPKAYRGGLRPIVERAAALARVDPVRGHKGAIVPALIANGYIERAIAAGSDPTKPKMASADPGRLWRLIKARARGRI